MSRDHEVNCNCPVCNNGIREERQYAVMKNKGLGEKEFILDACECSLWDAFINTDWEERAQPVLTKIMPDETKAPILAYGVLIPQKHCEVTDWSKELCQWKDYAFGSIEEETLKFSCYKDFALFEDHILYGSHIPCALLLHTTLDLTKEREYGFGHTMFQIFSNYEILDNIINRKYLYCLGGIEESFDGDDISNWEQYINRDKLMTVAKRLF